MEYLFGFAVLFFLYLIWDNIRQVNGKIEVLNANFVKNSVVIAQDIERIKEAVNRIKQDRQAGR